MKRIALIFVALVVLAAAYLFLWPVPIEPVAWQAPPAPPLEGQYAVNDALAGVERIGNGAGTGPEDVDVDAEGRIYAGYDDGRILRFDVEGRNHEEFVNTGGRPLGIDFAPDGTLLVADAKKGLLAVNPEGGVRVLTTSANDVPFKFVDDVDVGPDGAVYFSDASDKFGWGEELADILEHGGRGRLLRYEPLADRTTVLLDGLNFANGVALCPGGEYVLVNETGGYRTQRYWLKGPKTGQHDVFADNLPGLPDGVSCSEDGVIWIALVTPRLPDVEAMASKPWVRKIVMRLPKALHPKPVHHGFVLAFDQDGKLIHNLQDAGPHAYAPITTVEQLGEWLYFGSITEQAIGRIKAPSAAQQ